MSFAIEKNVPMPSDRHAWFDGKTFNYPYPAPVFNVGEYIGPFDVVTRVRFTPVSIQYETRSEMTDLQCDLLLYEDDAAA